MLLAQLDVGSLVDDSDSEAVAESMTAIGRLGEPNREEPDQPATAPWWVPDARPVPARPEAGSA